MLEKSNVETIKLLSETRTFSDVSPETLAELVACARQVQLPGGSTLIEPGSKYHQKVYILLEGDITMHRPSGRQDRVLPGDFIGLANYLDKNDHTSAAMVTTRSTLLEIGDADLTQLEKGSADLFNALNRVIASKLRERSPDRTISSGALAQPVTRVMKSPVSTCGPGTTLRDAFEMMKERKIGSTVVTDNNDRLLGILTYSGLAEAMLLKGASPGDSIMQAACETPIIIDSETPLWEAEELQKHHHSKYLVVVDGGTPIGVVAQTDILRVLISRPSTLTNRIRKSSTTNELAELASQLMEVAVEAQETNHLPSAAVRLLSETHLLIQRRVVDLTLEWMEEKGHGPAPAGFAILVMGSGGRKEMLLNPDQDNGLIIGDVDKKDAGAVNDWFDRFSKRLNKNLDKVGYPICPGEIMARNPLYRKTISEWKKQITHITKKPTEKAARWCNVLFDFDTLYGDDALTAELRRHAFSEISKRPRLLGMMVKDDAEGKPAIGFFNQLITTKDDKGEWIDIKRNGLRIIADAARIYSLQNGAAVQNTTDRLNALARVGVLSEDFKDSIQEAFEELLDLLLSHQIKKARAGKALDKLVDPEKLSPQSRGALRMAMRAVKRLQERLQDDFATDVF